MAINIYYNKKLKAKVIKDKLIFIGKSKILDFLLNENLKGIKKNKINNKVLFNIREPSINERLIYLSGIGFEIEIE